LHRLALAPLLPGATLETVRGVLNEAFGSSGPGSGHHGEDGSDDSQGGESDLSGFLERHGLASFWYWMLEEKGLTREVPGEFLRALHRQRLVCAGNYMVQRHHLEKVRRLFDDAGIAHLLFKGGHVRERIYDESSLRDACDLDLLVAREDRGRAVALLGKHGYSLIEWPENVSHEVSLVGQNGVIDLHWDLLRPGRTRCPLASEFLAGRRDFGSHWGPDDSASLFLMLVHPVFTKYVTAPQSQLMRVLDLYWWLEKVAVDWDEVLRWLDRSGLRTAGWVTLRWLALFGQPRVPHEVWQRLRPGRLRSSWLGWWVAGDFSSRWVDHPWIVQGALTLMVHDRAADAWRALRMRRRVRQQAAREMAALAVMDRD